MSMDPIIIFALGGDIAYVKDSWLTEERRSDNLIKDSTGSTWENGNFVELPPVVSIICHHSPLSLIFGSLLMLVT